MELILGLLTGIIFGFLLQKGRVLRFEKQVGAVLLKDMTILKFMLSAIVVGMVGIHLFVDLELVAFKVKSTHLGANIMGGLLFGAGWAVLGYCPGTALGALGEGRWHAIWGILGMLAGAALYAEAYPLIKKSILSWEHFGKIRLPDILHMNHWILIAAFALISLFLFRFFEKRNL